MQDVHRFPHAYRLERILSNGVPIALSVWWRHESASSVLFYPSTMASPLLHRFYLEELWRMGLNVVGLHPLSHGASPRIQKTFTVNDIIQNGVDAFTWLRERTSSPIVVSGHSQGGILALLHALRAENSGTYPDALFPFCTLLPQHPRAGEVTRFGSLLQHRERFLAGVRWLARVLPRLPICIPLYLEYDRIVAGARNPVALARYIRLTYPVAFVSSLFNADMHLACEQSHIRCPVFLMSACDDALFTPQLMETMLDAIHAPQKKILWISGGGHLAPMCPQFATETAARLAEQCAGMGLPLYHCGQTTF